MKYFDSWQQFPHQHPLQQHSLFLFDCDGLLLDTEPLYSAAACQLIKELSGKELKGLPAALKLAIMGQTRPFVAQKMTSWLLAEEQIHCDAEDWSRRVLPLEECLFAKGCALLPGAQEIVQLLSTRPSSKLALATSSHRRSFAIKSRPHHEPLFSRFSAIICGDELGDSTHSKPHPRIFQVAHLALDSDQSCVPLAFEDSPNGVVAALRAGCNVIWVPGEEIKQAASLEHLEQVIANERCSEEINSSLFVLRLPSITNLINKMN